MSSNKKVNIGGNVGGDVKINQADRDLNIEEGKKHSYPWYIKMIQAVLSWFGVGGSH